MRLYHRLRIQGVMPERALLKLRRANIALFHIRKTQNTAIECTVQACDVSKVFALYHDGTAFAVTDLGEVGFARKLSWWKNRIGVVLGVLWFIVVSVGAQQFVFGVDVVGASVYKREVYQTLNEYGVRPFRVYKEGKEKQISSALFALPGVEFSSVQKVGMRLRVELRLSAVHQYALQTGDWAVSHTGIITSMTLLKGTLTKKVGDTVQAGETLVHGWILTEDGEQVCVEPIARVGIACVYEGVYTAQSPEQAFAIAYLQLGLCDGDGVERQRVEARGEGYFVRLEYTVTESVNLS